MKHGHNPATYRAIAIGNGACHVGFATVSNCIGAQEADANAQLIAQAPDLLRQRDKLREALEQSILALRSAYAAAYCGPQNWTPEEREALRLQACDADATARAILAETEAA